MDGQELDQRVLNRIVEQVAASHQALLAALTDRDWDPRQPSALPGWSIGHLLTHLARQADSVVRMLDGLSQYEGGVAGRTAEIEAGAGRDRDALVDDVRRSIWGLESRWATHQDWEASATLISGAVVACHELPFRRWREVVIHHIDLGIGMGFADLPAEYLRRELGIMEMMWNARQPMGLTGLPAKARELAPPERLAWLMGRVEVPGLDPAGIY